MDYNRSRCYGSIRSIPLVFEDLTTSDTIKIVTTELESDCYGLEQIKLLPTDTVIDIGGNIGMFSIYVKKKFGCKVIAFEPVQINYEQFKKNILLNGLSLSDIELHNVAITDKEGDKIKISTPVFNTGASSEYTKGGVISYCITETINKYITTDCKYLKVDCEGAEYKIIPSIIHKINQFKYIGIEYHKLTETQDPKSLHSLLTSEFKGRIFQNTSP
jgi:FkbM family methyltransferase